MFLLALNLQCLASASFVHIPIDFSCLVAGSGSLLCGGKPWLSLRALFCGGGCVLLFVAGSLLLLRG